jgi:hypothetical protein
VSADLLVIVPSRGRPQHIAALHDAWQATSAGVASLLVAVDNDDATLPEYQRVCDERGIWLEVGPRLRLGGTLNKLATKFADTYGAIGFLGDDHRPRTGGFDRHLVSALGEMGTGIAYGNDLLRAEDLPTAVVMTSDIIQALGYMVPAGLVHLWIDNAWLELGRGIDRITYLPDVVIEHLHPIVGKGEWDDVYVECNSEEQLESDRGRYRAWLEDGLAADVAKLKALL